jgi:hypothetical protein
MAEKKISDSVRQPVPVGVVITVSLVVVLGVVVDIIGDPTSMSFQPNLYSMMMGINNSLSILVALSILILSLMKRINSRIGISFLLILTLYLFASDLYLSFDSPEFDQKLYTTTFMSLAVITGAGFAVGYQLANSIIMFMAPSTLILALSFGSPALEQSVPQLMIAYIAVGLAITFLHRPAEAIKRKMLDSEKTISVAEMQRARYERALRSAANTSNQS